MMSDLMVNILFFGGVIAYVVGIVIFDALDTSWRPIGAGVKASALFWPVTLLFLVIVVIFVACVWCVSRPFIFFGREPKA